jgi:putative flippase GtrA
LWDESKVLKVKVSIAGFYMNDGKNKLSVQILKYGLVGGVAFALDFSLLFVLTEYLHLYYILSATVAFVAGLLCNYFLSVYWVFNERALSNKYAEFLVFSLIGLVGLLLNDGLIWSLTELGRIHYLASKVLAAVAVFFWNFFARRQVLFISRTKVTS